MKSLKKILPITLSMLLLASAVPTTVSLGDNSILKRSFTVAAAEEIEEDSDLDDLDFYQDSDRIFVLGETSTIDFFLYDEDEDPYTGNVSNLTGYISDPDGEITYVSVSGRLGYFSTSNITFDKIGEYTLVIWDEDGNNAGGTVGVVEPILEIKGSLVINTDNSVTVVLEKPDGSSIPRESITVDGTDVGANSSTYTTLYDGSFNLSMTPTKYGEVKFIYGGHVIGTMEVSPAYTQGSRIGAKATDNVTLSVEISQEGWESSSFVILTRDDNIADAMASVPLSEQYGAPILMTPSDRLDDKVFSEILRLGAERIYIIGGTGAISENVENTLYSAGIDCYRISGTDRYDTAAQISERVGSSDTVYLASGYGVSDALAASSFAAEKGIPILLTGTHTLPEVTKKKLQELDASQIIILGGTGVVSTEVEEELASQYLVKRWGGADRYSTQQIILQNLIEEQGPLYVTTTLLTEKEGASGKPKAHALLVAALAAKNNGFVITLPNTTLPSAVNYSLLYNKGYISSTTIVGNTNDVSISLEQQIHEMLDR